MTDIAVVIGAAVFVFLYLGKTEKLTGYSMEPTLTNGDVIMIDKLTYSLSQIRRFDVVVFRTEGTDNTYVKRVIGMPGESVSIKDGAVYIDGKKLEERFEAEKILNAGLAEDTVILGEDEYFVLGDNRNNSEDSRHATVGNVRRSDIIGRAWLEITSYKDFGLVK